jgi:hypothetical protein
MEAVKPASGSPRRRFPSWLLMFIVFSNICLLSCVVWAYAGFGSVAAAIDYYHGRYLRVRNTEASFFNATPGQDVRVSYIVENHGPRPVRILGCSLGCVGRPATKLPFVLEPGTARPFAVDVRVFAPRPSAPKLVRSPGALYTDDPNQPDLALSIAFTVSVPNDGAGASK